MYYKTVIGNYPRQSWLRESLLKAEGKQKKSGATDLKVDLLYDKATLEVIREFESLGLDIITDGQLRWTDSLASFCETLAGFKMTGLIRFYDNNFYYSQPEVNGKIVWKKPVYTADFLKAKKAAKKPLKWILPGPYTLARLCKNSYYSNMDWLMADLSLALSSEAEALSKAGCRILQIDEPSLVYDNTLKAELPRIKEVLAKVESAFNGTTILQTYFGSFNEAIADFLDLKFDVFGFDLVDGKNNMKFLKEHPVGRDVSLGVVNSRDILMEKPQKIIKTLKTAAKYTESANIHATPNWGLELMPREYAVKKLSLLCKTVDSIKKDKK